MFSILQVASLYSISLQRKWKEDAFSNFLVASCKLCSVLVSPRAVAAARPITARLVFIGRAPRRPRVGMLSAPSQTHFVETSVQLIDVY